MPRRGDRFTSDLFQGGPYQHRTSDGVCRVCGATGDMLEQVGCPAQGIPHADGERLSSAAQAEAAARWLHEQARKEESK